MPDRIDSHVKLKAKTRIPLSGAEHEYTDWGFRRFVEKDALDILWPDIYWRGGLSEAGKIAAYATKHDLIVIPHGHSTPIGIHFSVAQSPIHTPYQEYLDKWDDINMHFLQHPLRPVGVPSACPMLLAQTWRSILARSSTRRTSMAEAASSTQAAGDPAMLRRGVLR